MVVPALASETAPARVPDDAERPAVKHAVCEGRVSSCPLAHEVSLLGAVSDRAAVAQSLDDPVLVGFVEQPFEFPFVGRSLPEELEFVENHAHVEPGAEHGVVVAPGDGVAAAPDGLRILVQDAGKLVQMPAVRARLARSFRTRSWVAS